MLAVEFEADVKNWIIQIPERYKKVVAGKFKIITLKAERPTTSVFKKTAGDTLKQLLNRIREKNIFHSIDDPVEWQKKNRDEWSES